MLDFDLARLYAVETKILNKAVKRNIARFPDDFMFELSEEEFASLRFQFGTSRWGGRRYRPYAFTEQGVAMLSSVLRSGRAGVYGFFGVWYSASFWNGSQTVSKPTNPFSFGGIWRVVRKRARPSGTLAGGCFGFSSLMRHLLP